MARASIRLLTAVFVLLLFALPARAQEKGGVTGRVTDKRTGHALPFASITVMGAKSGGLTDSEGQFLITGIPVGTYEIRVQFLGYKPDSRPGVVIAPGKPVQVNFQLEDVVVREEKVVEVTAERRLVEVKQGATIRSVNSAEIRNLAVTTVADVLQQQAGISTDADQIHVRGGRTDETVFVINGVANRDLVTGQSTAGQLNARSVGEVNVATGAFDVRYGNALSGVVEIKLKEGGEDFSGGITTSAGSFGGRAWQLVMGGPDRHLRFLGSTMLAAAIPFGVGVERGIYPAAAAVAAAGVSFIKLPGSVSSILDVSGSQLATRFHNITDLPGHQRLESGYEDALFGKHFKYGSFFSPSEDNRWAARYGMTWKPNASDKVSLNLSKRIAIDQGFSRTFFNANGDAGDPAYPWQWAHRIDHSATIFEDNVQSSIEWRRTLSTTGYTDIQLSRYFYAERQDVKGKYFKPNTNYIQPDPPDLFFYENGDDNTWQDRRTESYEVQWNLVQRYHHNEIELGLSHDFQNVQFVTVTDPWANDPTGSGLGDIHDVWKAHPWAGDFYVRDRLEFEGFIANFGLRGDYWFVGREAERAIGDTSNANVSPASRQAFYDHTRNFFGRRYKLHVSPRLIVAFPVTENSSFFFNYGQFTQNPSYRYVYSKLTSISSESFPLLGNPDLNPQISVNYEVGGKYQFRPTAAVNATLFVKDTYDYPAATSFTRQQGTDLVPILVYLNGHFARSKGFELEFEKRRSHNWSGKISYTFQQTRGKSSDPNEAKVLKDNGGSASETRLGEAFVRWNRPHKISVNFDMRFDKDGPLGQNWLRGSGINLFVEGASGRAYTPQNTSTAVLAAAAEPYSRNGPFQVTADMRANRKFTVAGQRFDLSLAGTNIFGNRLINRIDPVTGEARIWGVGSYDPALFPKIDEYTRISEVEDPSNFGPGAQWRLSLDYDF